MIIKELYESVSQTADTSPAVFLAHLDTTVRSLIARHGQRYVLIPRQGQGYIKPTNVNGEIPIYEEYFSAIADNIRYLITGDEARKSDYVQEATDAYKQVWSLKMRGKKFRDRGYYDV